MSGFKSSCEFCESKRSFIEAGGFGKAKAGSDGELAKEASAAVRRRWRLRVGCFIGDEDCAATTSALLLPAKGRDEISTSEPHNGVALDKRSAEIYETLRSCGR